MTSKTNHPPTTKALNDLALKLINQRVKPITVHEENEYSAVLFNIFEQALQRDATRMQLIEAVIDAIDSKAVKRAIDAIAVDDRF